MRFFSSPSLALCAAGLVAASGCSLIASPDESLLNGSGGDPSQASSSVSTGSVSSTSTSSSSPTTSVSSGGGEGGDTGSSTASQGGGGSNQGGGGNNEGGGGSNQGGGGSNQGGGGSNQGGGGAGQGGGNQGGGGGGPDCVDPEVDCDPTGNECIRAICDAGVCSTEPVDQGTETSLGQTDGDCRVVVCDGEGGTEELDDDDPPAIDPDECIASVSCVNGDVVPVFEPENEPCGVGGALFCNDSGVCQGCTQPSQCGADPTCQARTCDAGVCGLVDLDDGTLVPDADENCRRTVCTAGAPVIEDDDLDIEDDGNDCTIDACDAGDPTHDPEAAQTACDLNGTDDGFCDGTADAGACVECVVDDNCGNNNLCEINNCNAGNTCDAQVLIGTGIEVADPTPGDCQHTECDGAGNTLLNQPDDDPPADVANDCTTPACVGGANVPNNLPAGTACSVPSGNECNNAGQCVAFFCTSDADCDGNDTFCSDSSCTIATGVCNGTPRNGGLVDTDVVDDPNDCRDNVCVAGVSTPQNADTETPLADANSCTQEICLNGTPHPPVATHDPCIGGGGFCTAGQACVQCTQDGPQCPSGSCDEGTNTCDAAAPTCVDLIQNQGESDVDCGGPNCLPCGNDDACFIDSDCTSDFCNPNTDVCATPTCGDTFTNQDETDTDCGGICGANCLLGDTCVDDGDCASGECNTTNFTCSLASAATLLSENFDGLPNSGTSTFDGLEALLTSGWQIVAQQTTTQAGTGSSNAGAVYSFGAAATNERALGSLASGSNSFSHWGICRTNTTGATLTNINVAYNGEQWRSGTVSADSVAFAFTTFATIIGDLATGVDDAATGDDTTGWETVAALGYTGPDLTAAGAIDGNSVGRVTVSGQVPGLTVANGASFCVRWSDVNIASTDSGLGIDDLVITGL